MTFPVWIPIGPWQLHPHVVFESLAYVIGFSVYIVRRHRLGDHLPNDVRWSLVTAAAVGAVVGSRLLFWLEDLPATIRMMQHLEMDELAGKTAVGGLIGA